MVDMRVMQLPLFNRTAFIDMTTVSYLPVKSHSCVDVKGLFLKLGLSQNADREIIRVKELALCFDAD